MATKKERDARDLLERAVTWAGSKPALAVEMRTSEQTIHSWVKAGCVPKGPARLLGMLLAEEEGFDPDAAWLEQMLRGEAA